MCACVCCTVCMLVVVCVRVRANHNQSILDSGWPPNLDLPRFSPRFYRIFSGEALDPIFSQRDARFFVLHNCILIFDAEQVYLKPQVSNFMNKEVKEDPNPQTLSKNWFFETLKP